MKITRLECWHEEFALTEPYLIAYERIEEVKNAFIAIETDRSIVGWGCAAPDVEVTGETIESVKESFAAIIEPYLKGKDPFTYSLLLEDLKSQLKNNSSALAMADMALYDLIGKKTSEPVYRLLGGYRKSISTSITIGILPVFETMERAKICIQSGFTIIKIKGGRNIEEDIERVIKLREETGQLVKIRFDSNQGYSVPEAIRFINETKKANIELFEQPTQKDNFNLLKQVSKQIQVPVMADESLMTLKDVFQLTTNECTDLINIKLMKVGGISEAQRINSVAQAAKVGTMIGCMDESAMGIAAGLHFALARTNVLYADLDGHFDLIDDPFASMVKCEDGILYPSNLPGFGWSE